MFFCEAYKTTVPDLDKYIQNDFRILVCILFRSVGSDISYLMLFMNFGMSRKNENFKHKRRVSNEILIQKKILKMQESK